jgi:hypothetical protein
MILTDRERSTSGPLPTRTACIHRVDDVYLLLTYADGSYHLHLFWCKAGNELLGPLRSYTTQT